MSWSPVILPKSQLSVKLKKNILALVAAGKSLKMCSECPLKAQKPEKNKKYIVFNILIFERLGLAVLFPAFNLIACHPSLTSSQCLCSALKMQTAISSLRTRLKTWPHVSRQLNNKGFKEILVAFKPDIPSY